MRNHSPKIGAGIIIIENNKILLSKRKGPLGDGMWGSAGGHVEFGETPTEAVIREAKEELGITLKQVEFLCCIDIQMQNTHYVDVGFKAKIAKGEPKIQPSEKNKIEVVGWFSLDNLPNPLFPPISAYLEAIKSGKTYFEIRQKS